VVGEDKVDSCTILLEVYILQSLSYHSLEVVHGVLCLWFRLHFGSTVCLTTFTARASTLRDYYRLLEITGDMGDYLRLLRVCRNRLLEITKEQKSLSTLPSDSPHPTCCCSSCSGQHHHTTVPSCGSSSTAYYRTMCTVRRDNNNINNTKTT